MLLSLMETIVVMHLLGKDSESQDNEADKDQSLSEDCADRQGKNNFNNCFRGEIEHRLEDKPYALNTHKYIIKL